MKTPKDLNKKIGRASDSKPGSTAAAPVHLPDLPETLERLRISLGVDFLTWADYLEQTPAQYADIRERKRALPITSLAQLAYRLNVSLEHFWDGTLDYQAIAAEFSGNRAFLPERYLVGAESRRRSSLNLINSVEEFLGWETRARLLRALQVSEGAFHDQDALINQRFAMDLTQWLRNQGITDNQLVLMGAYSVITYGNSPIGRELSALGSVKSLYEHLFENLISKHIEKNFRYRLLEMTEYGCSIEARERPEVAEALAVQHVGNSEICQTKVGVSASVPAYLGLPFAEVRETQCVHRGDPSCVFDVDFERASQVLRRQSPEHAAHSH